MIRADTLCRIDGTLVEDKRAWKVAIRQSDTVTGGTRACLEFERSHLSLSLQTWFIIVPLRMHRSENYIFLVNSDIQPSGISCTTGV